MLELTVSCYNSLQIIVKLDLTDLQIAYNHETRFERNKFRQFLAKFLEEIKIPQNSHLEHSILKFARLCAGKSLIYLNLYM